MCRAIDVGRDVVQGLADTAAVRSRVGPEVHTHQAAQLCQPAQPLEVHRAVRERAGAHQLEGLAAVGLDLRSDARGLARLERGARQPRVAREQCQRRDLRVVPGAVIVARTSLLLSDIARAQPLEIGGHPGAHPLPVRIPPVGGALQHADRVHQTDERPRLDDSRAAAFGDARDPLPIAEVRVHPGGGIEEPHPQQLRGARRVFLVVAEVVGERQRSDVTGERAQAGRIVVATDLGVALTVAADVRQAVRLGGVGPPVRPHAHVVVLIAGGRRALLVHHGERPGREGGRGLPYQPVVRRPQGRVAARETPLGSRERIRPQRVHAQGGGGRDTRGEPWRRRRDAKAKEHERCEARRH